MQEEAIEFREDESGFGVLALRPLRIHNSHVQMGKRYLVGCSLCQGTMEGAIEEQYFTPKAAGVDEGAGVDKERDAALPPDPWSDR